MTRKEAIEAIRIFKAVAIQNMSETSDFAIAFDMAVRSLEAWDKIIGDIDAYIDSKEYFSGGEWNVFISCRRVIQKHLKEVEE